MANPAGGVTDGRNPPAIGEMLHSHNDKTTVAIIDPKSRRGGGHIRTPGGKRLKSFDFMCCSKTDGNSILEGHPCKQVKCKVTASSSRISNNGKRIKETERAATSTPFDAVAGAAPTALTTTTFFVAEGGKDDTTVARDVVVNFTGFTPVRSAVGRRRRANGSAATKAADDVTLVITNMVVVPVEEAEQES
ncbi:hypothetical protein ABW20_dc0105704 [Dactylellina cionopaga]|nr:hypothetical protein ABW20_dc0105704 [Dactylellina cionopaga]